jgi:hypothetical protein
MSEQTSLLKGEGSFARCSWCDAHIIEIKLDFGPILRIEPHERGTYALHGGYARIVYDGRLWSHGRRDRKPIRKIAEGELRYAPHFMTCGRAQAGLEARPEP